MEPVKRKSHDIDYIGQREEYGETVLEGVGNLPCKRVEGPHGTVLLSHWRPSPEELEVLVDGGVVELGLYAEPIPPVSVNVAPGEPGDEPAWPGPPQPPDDLPKPTRHG